MVAAASAQEGKPFEALRAALNSLTSRVSALEQQPRVTSDLTIADAGGQTIGRAMFNGNSTYAVMIVDGVAAAFQVGDGGFRQAVAAPTEWYQSTDCSGDPFLTNDTGVIRQGQVVGTTGVYAKGQFTQLQFHSRRAYPSGTCSALTFTSAGAELGTVDLSAYRAPFTVAD